MGVFWPNAADDCYSSISVNTGLGLSFLRIVNEEGSNGWAQVYARIPFDDDEISSKGALFGVIFCRDKENWAERDAELMGWVEEYFNKLETGGELSDFFQKWSTNYPDLTAVWLWVVEREGGRQIMMVRLGEVGIALLRKGKEFDFSTGMIEGKVAKGNTEEGDRIAVWTDGLLDKTDGKRLTDLNELEATQLNEKMRTEDFASAGIILDFQKFSERVEETPSENVIMVTERKVEPEIETAKIEDKFDQELVDGKYVGPIGFKEKISNWWMKVTAKFRRPTYQEDISLQRGNPKRKKWAVTLGILFLGLLVVSLISGSIKIRREAEIKRWREFSEPIEKSLSEAVGVMQLSPSGARKLVQDAKSAYVIRNTDFLKSGHVKELGILEKKIEETWTLVSGEKESQIEELARIDLVRQGFKGDRSGLIKDKQLVVLDGSMGVIMTVDTGTKDIKVVAGKGEGLGWIDVVGDSNKTMTLNGSGVRDAISGQDLVKFDAAVIKPVAMGRFGGNLYVLDQGNKEIFKYAAVGDGFGERTRWLKQGQNMDIEPVDMAMDIDIWVVSVDGQVEKFRRGSKEQFSLNGLATGMKINRLAVELEGDKIALLDSTSGAVALCSKTTGGCSQMLKSEKLREAKDLEFDTKGNLLVLLPGVIGVIK